MKLVFFNARFCVCNTRCKPTFSNALHGKQRASRLNKRAFQRKLPRVLRLKRTPWRSLHPGARGGDRRVRAGARARHVQRGARGEDRQGARLDARLPQSDRVLRDRAAQHARQRGAAARPRAALHQPAPLRRGRAGAAARARPDGPRGQPFFSIGVVTSGATLT